VAVTARPLASRWFWWRAVAGSGPSNPGRPVRAVNPLHITSGAQLAPRALASRPMRNCVVPAQSSVNEACGGAKYGEGSARTLTRSSRGDHRLIARQVLGGGRSGKIADQAVRRVSNWQRWVATRAHELATGEGGGAWGGWQGDSPNTVGLVRPVGWEGPANCAFVGSTGRRTAT